MPYSFMVWVGSAQDLDKSSPPTTGNRLWPTWLLDDVPGLDVWSVGYEAPVSNWNGSAMALGDRAESVLSLLLIEADLQEGELIFIGHSLGGLVIKQLLRKAVDAAIDPMLGKFVERCHKVIFLATSHRSGAGSLGRRVSGINTPIFGNKFIASQ